MHHGSSGITGGQHGPFGETLRSSGLRASKCNWKFATKYADREGGATYFGFRYYWAELARMASRDWIDEPRSDNLYAICDNALISYYDYLGLMIGVYVGPSHSTGARAYELIPGILSRTIGELLRGAIPGADPKKCKCVVWLNRLPADMRPLDSLIVWAKAHPDPASQTVLWTLAHPDSRGYSEPKAESIESALRRIKNLPPRLYWSGSYTRWGVEKSHMTFADFQDTGEESTALASGVHFLRHIGAELQREGCVKASVFTQHIADTYTRAFDIMWRSTAITVGKNSPAYRETVIAIESLGGKTVPWERY